MAKTFSIKYVGLGFTDLLGQDFVL